MAGPECESRCEIADFLFDEPNNAQLLKGGVAKGRLIDFARKNSMTSFSFLLSLWEAGVAKLAGLLLKQFYPNSFQATWKFHDSSR